METKFGCNHNHIHNHYKTLFYENMILSYDNYFVNFTIFNSYIAV